ncbi:hypothetical protein D4764_14G0006960 [Takifugu flavidus]|uniref:Retrotransposon gag domain-containing protein n=1 Tax=Takifugu flavidus TaxID=433684 RepID=A0A5C6P513_9TELE|nr:hypothetical protein D4764_14G0006960 [Takifugu flavidus]
MDSGSAAGESDAKKDNSEQDDGDATSSKLLCRWLPPIYREELYHTMKLTGPMNWDDGSDPQGSGRALRKIESYARSISKNAHREKRPLTSLMEQASPGQQQIAAWETSEGKALQILTDLQPEERFNWQAIERALKHRFGRHAHSDDARDKLVSRRREEGESLGAYAADLRFYDRRGYPTFHAIVQDELALQAFVRGLQPERLREHIRLHAPKTLTEALDESERIEHVLSMGDRPTNTSTSPTKPSSSASILNIHPTHPPSFGKSQWRLGRLGRTNGLYLDCTLNDTPCRALVDTGSTILLVRPGTLPSLKS